MDGEGIGGWQRANARAKTLLKEHQVDYIDSKADSRIRRVFKILLDNQ